MPQRECCWLHCYHRGVPHGSLVCIPYRASVWTSPPCLATKYQPPFVIPGSQLLLPTFALSHPVQGLRRGCVSCRGAVAFSSTWCGCRCSARSQIFSVPSGMAASDATCRRTTACCVPCALQNGIIRGHSGLPRLQCCHGRAEPVSLRRAGCIPAILGLPLRGIRLH